jgi:LCP family protein required for cell wall assembly
MTRRSIASFLGVLIAVLALGGLWLGWQVQRAYSNVQAMVVTPAALPTSGAAPEEPGATPQSTAAPRPGEPISILLLGSDALPGQEVSRTDVIILVRVDPRSGQVAMLSFPRDLWAPIPGHGEARINAAFPIGERQIGPGYGPALARRTVSELVGLPVDRFVLIDFAGFIRLIDRLGGIEVDVPAPLDDPSFPVGERRIHVHFDAGPQLMDGERALTYVRTRHADSDLGRNQRQQQVLMAIFDRLREQNLLVSMAELDEYTAAMRDYVRTDLTYQDMALLAGVARELRPEQIRRYAIGSDMLVPLPRPATFGADPLELQALVARMCAGTCPPLRVVADGKQQAES